MSRAQRTRAGRWVGPALIGMAAIFLVAGVLLFVAGEPSEPRDFRAISRALVIGAALGAYGAYRVASGDGADKPGADAARPAARATAARRTPRGRASGASLEGMLCHTDDVLATLRDVVAHATPDAGLGPAPALLARSGLMGWEGAPTGVLAGRLGRTRRWWLRSPIPLEGADYDRLVAVEAALNVAEDVKRGVGRDAHEVLARVGELEPLHHEGQRSLASLVAGSQTDGEWRLRVALADYLENCPLPYRSTFDLQTNAEAGLACVDVSCPAPACLSLVGEDEAAGEARAYALRLAVLVARGALEGVGLGRAVVNVLERGERCVMSIDVTPTDLERLRALGRDVSLSSSPLPDDPALRARSSSDGALETVEPLMGRGDEAVCPRRERFRTVELDDAPAGEELARACGAQRMSDLGINEAAGRMSAWNSVVTTLDGTTADAVAKLVRIRDATTDVTVAEACKRTTKALVEGTVDATDRCALAVLFVGGDDLSRAVRRALAVDCSDDSTPDELESSLSEVEAALAPVTEMGIYLDDPDSVYRYFSSVAERVLYNRTVDDGERAVRLVPDDYYNAHSVSARLLNRLGKNDEALAHADELVRIAPMTPAAALVKVRCLEEQSRIFEAADLLKRTTASAASRRDMSIALYRLAYMEWRLGRSDLAVACYQRAIALRSDISRQARAELDDLLGREEGLSRLPDEQVVPTLEAAGIPAGDTRAASHALLDAAIACTDANVFLSAHPLVCELAEFSGDDVLYDVGKSLSCP